MNFEPSKAGTSGLRVLVTGGAGFLGSVVCEQLLAAGYQVTALDNLSYGQASLFHLCAHPGFNFISADVRDEAAMRRALRDAEVIIPLADARRAHELSQAGHVRGKIVLRVS